MKQSDFTPEEEQMIEQEFRALLDDYAHTRHSQKVEIITKAFNFANQAHHGVRRLSGEPYMMHPLAVARIVVKDIGLGSTSICSALLHDVVEDTDYTTEDIRNLFGDKIAQIVDGLTKISGGVFGEKASEQAENFRKLLLTMSDDIRVVLIKIADRLHNMRTLGAQPLEKQYKIAGETQYIYAPLAHRLGLFPIKTELENLSFRYEHPDKYAEIEKELAANKDAQTEWFEQFAAPIHEKLAVLGLKYSLTARIKSPFSIWKKMSTKNIPFEEVYDLMAVRIIFTPNDTFPEKDQCWMVYSAITEVYRPHPERIRDWISTPKANGYEALHVTVMAQNGQWVEVQIRTDRMHELAERGLAAHWKYKTGESSESELDKWLRDIKEALSHPDQNAMEFLGTFKLNLFAQEVFVFTPKGEIKTMPQNATALDFAYQLHSELGDHCIGAKVNHSLVPLSYILQSGDQIEILTSANQFPQEEWLDFVTTAKAQSCLRNYFKKEERQYERNGEKIFNEAVDLLGAGGIRFTALQRTLNYYHLHQPAMLYMQIGQGNIQMTNLKDIIYPKKSLWKRINPFATSNDDAVTPEEEPKNTADLSKALLQKKKSNKKIVLTDENLGKDYFLADCCHPIPGDEVLGYMDDNGKIYIHKVDCAEAQLLKTSHGERIFSATWGTHRVQSYVETISLFGIDKLGVFIKVLSIITIDFHINVRSINAMSEDGIFKGTIDLFIYDKQELDDLFEALMKLEDVKSVKRIEQTTN
ncbi:MAG: RelA/SpoT family protein [Paludibacteraceae bacterium]|nr:RelA/SpoT family protein [Paludibacteraceae bacterium]